MKISAVKNINNCSRFKGIENKKETQMQECKNVQLMLGLVAVSSITLACVAIKNSQNNNKSGFAQNIKTTALGIDEQANTAKKTLLGE